MTDRGAPLADIAAALLLPTVACVSAPNNIIFRNLLDLPYSGHVVLFFVWAFLLAAGVGVALFLVAVRVSLAQACARMWLLCGAHILVSDAVAYATQAHLQRFIWVVLVDATVLVSLGSIFARVRFSLLRSVCAVIAVLLLAEGVTSHALGVWRLRRAADRRAVEAAAILASPRASQPVPSRGNVYHVLLDAYQGEVFGRLAEDQPELLPKGFTYYPAFISHYDFTAYSLPNLLTGRFYDPGESMSAWRDSMLTSGLWADLASAGVDLTLYPYWEFHCSPLARHCTSAQDSLRKSLPGSVPAEFTAARPEYTTIDLWFLSLLPHSVRRVLNRGWTKLDGPPAANVGQMTNGFSLMHYLSPPSTEVGLRLADQNDFGVFSVRHFRAFLVEEAYRSAHGQYVFIHAMLPHVPYVVDAECRYIGSQKQATPEGYLAQATCGARLVTALVRRLQELDRFDDALIVVHGDHGMLPEVADALIELPGYKDLIPAMRHSSPTEGPVGDSATRAWRNARRIAQRSGALLLVKYPGTSTFGTSNAPAQMIDIAPTILQYFDADIRGYVGIPLQQLREDPTRQAMHFGAQKGPQKNRPRGGTFSRFALTGQQWRYVDEVPTRE